MQKNSTPSLTQRQAISLLEAIPTETLQEAGSGKREAGQVRFCGKRDGSGKREAGRVRFCYVR